METFELFENIKFSKIFQFLELNFFNKFIFNENIIECLNYIHSKYIHKYSKNNKYKQK